MAEIRGYHTGRDVNSPEQRKDDSRSLQIRMAGPQEAHIVARVLLESFLEFERLYTPKGFAATTPEAPQVLARMREGPIWLAFHDAEVLGTVAAVLKPDSVYVRGMAVLPAARGLKVGARLLQQVEHWATVQDRRRLFLTTTPFLQAAIRLYEKFGYQRTSTGPNNLFGTPLFTMEKYLTRATS